MSLFLTWLIREVLSPAHYLLRSSPEAVAATSESKLNKTPNHFDKIY